jgi:hypothetical protein
VTKYLVGLAAILMSGVVAAGDLSAVAGHYRYQDYAATLPDGRVLKLQDLGAKDAFLDISEDGCTWIGERIRLGSSGLLATW